jgi:putative oxidoreductase
MLKKILSTENDAVLTLIRVALGVVMFPHGAQKLLGWYGGYGWSGTMGFLTGTMGVPALLAALVILGEFFGSLGLITGLFGRVAAFGVLSTMIGAVVLVHAKVGFFMNWAGSQQGEGFEFHILAAAMALAIVWKGSGAHSVDRAISARA